MVYKTIIESFDKDDLVNIFSTALYGSDALTADYEDKYKKYTTPGTCFEDKLADILLNGGEIMLIDLNSEEDEEIYGLPRINWNSTSIERIAFHNFFGHQEQNCIAYHISLKSLINGINDNNKAQDYVKELLIDETGDYYTAFNLLQCAVWGEEIYG